MMRFFSRRRARPEVTKFTGVGTILSAAHRDQRTGKIHGHTWEITAWFKWAGVDQAVHLHCLNEIIKTLDHTCLPDAVAWGEQLAEYIGNQLNLPWCNGPPLTSCVAVDVSRMGERIYARWENPDR